MPSIGTVCEHDAHGVDGGAVGAVLVAPAHPPRRGQRGRLGDPDELEGEVAVGGLPLCAHGRTIPDARRREILERVTARDEWQAAFEAAPTRDVDCETMSGVPLEPVYGPDDGEFPGQYPYTRGPVRLDVPLEALDDADVRRLRHGRGHQRPLPRDPARRAATACRPRSTCRR